MSQKGVVNNKRALGYPDAVSMATKAINDRERLKYALESVMQMAGVSPYDRSRLIEQIRACDFEEFNRTMAVKLHASIKPKEAKHDLFKRPHCL